MAQTITSRSGDGVTAELLDVTVVLPDAGQSITVVGGIQLPGQSFVSFTGSPVSAPVVPGAGFTGWLIQSTALGVLSVKTANNAMPTVDAGSYLIYQDKVQSTDNSDMALGDPAAQSPDTW